MDVPPEYVGREHTWLKHRVLQLYVEGWAHKLASLARSRAVRLWYVDCFSGPWKARGQDLRDTSISIGLQALESAAHTWASAQFGVGVGTMVDAPVTRQGAAGKRRPFHSDPTNAEARGDRAGLVAHSWRNSVEDPPCGKSVTSERRQGGGRQAYAGKSFRARKTLVGGRG